MITLQKEIGNTKRELESLNSTIENKYREIIREKNDKVLYDEQETMMRYKGKITHLRKYVENWSEMIKLFKEKGNKLTVRGEELEKSLKSNRRRRQEPREKDV